MRTRGSWINVSAADPGTDWLELPAGAVTISLQAAYDGGGNADIEVSSPVANPWRLRADDNVTDILMLMSRNATGAAGEQTVFKAPDQLADAAIDGTTFTTAAGDSADRSTVNASASNGGVRLDRAGDAGDGDGTGNGGIGGGGTWRAGTGGAAGATGNGGAGGDGLFRGGLGGNATAPDGVSAGDGGEGEFFGGDGGSVPGGEGNTSIGGDGATATLRGGNGGTGPVGGNGGDAVVDAGAGAASGGVAGEITHRRHQRHADSLRPRRHRSGITSDICASRAMSMTSPTSSNSSIRVPTLADTRVPRWRSRSVAGPVSADAGSLYVRDDGVDSARLRQRLRS